MPFPIIALLISAAFSVAGALLSPRPKTKATALKDFNVPTATESRPQPYFFGTIEHQSPNTVWWGDYATKAIKTGGALTLFIKTVIGFKYFIGFDVALSVVEFDNLRKIIVNDKVAWEGTIKDGTITIDKPQLFGTQKTDGGFQATVEVYSGTADQTASPYLRSKVDPAYPPYRRRGHLVFRGLTGSGGAYIGNQAQLGTMKFVLERFPNQLGVTGGKHIVNSADANPVCVLYEVLTNSEIGAGYLSSDFNLDSWKAAAESCYTDGYGISGLIDALIDVDKLVDELLKVIDGVINQNLETAEFELDLARADYDFATLPSFSQDDILSYELERMTWLDNVNSMSLSYIDRENGFSQRDITLQNTAMSFLQLESRSQSVDIQFISTAALANKVCYREMVVTTLPLARVKLTLNRKAYNLRPAKVFKLVDTPYNLTNIALRVTKVEPGSLTDGKIQIEAVEDVFGLAKAVFSPPPITGWTAPSTNAENITTEKVIELPRFFHQTDNQRIGLIAAPVNTAQGFYDGYVQNPVTESNYVLRQPDQTFCPTGTLNAGYSSLTYDAGSTLVVVPGQGMDDLPDAVDLSLIRQGAGLMLIDNEILGYESFSIDGSGHYVFTGVYGGLLDTVLSSHSTSARVWFISEGMGIVDNDYNGTSSVNAKLSSEGAIDLVSCTLVTATLSHRAERPMPPVDLSFS